MAFISRSGDFLRTGQRFLSQYRTRAPRACLKETLMTEDISLQELLRVGAHFGHRKAKWHPRMESFLYAKRDGVHIIDLQKTVEGLENALKFVAEQAAAGKSLMFVGTKRQARDIVKKTAKEAGAHYMAERWIGGLLTNFTTMKTRIKRLNDLREMFETKEVEKYPKKERLVMQEEMRRLERNFGGVSTLKGLPDMLFVVDAKSDKLAVAEARSLNIPVIALADSNVDPTQVTHPIPSNDDAVKVIEYMTGKIADAYKNNFKAPAAPKAAAKKDEYGKTVLMKKDEKKAPVKQEKKA